MIRPVLILLGACVLATAQSPVVQIHNLSRPASRNFQVGDRFEITVSAAPHQPISIRTTRNYSRTDWGPVIASTDAKGQWSIEGRFERADFGEWSEAWTAGGELANPVVSFRVDGPCVAEGRGLLGVSGPNQVLICETPAGQQQTFATPSTADSFRTPDGRVIPAVDRSNMTAEAYRLEITQSMLMGSPGPENGRWTVEAGEWIPKLIGVNALTESETRRALAIVKSAWEPLAKFRASEARKSAMLALLRQLAAGAEQASLRNEIADTISFVQRQ